MACQLTTTQELQQQQKPFMKRLLSYPSPFTVALQATIVLFATTWFSWLLFFVSLALTIVLFIVQMTKASQPIPAAPKVVLITGGSTGIGAALAVKYAQEGTETIYITGRTQSGLEDTVKRCKEAVSTTKSAKFNIIPVQLDVCDQAGMESKLKEIYAQTPVDCVIANSGISPEQQKHKPQEAIFRDTYNTNITGVVNTIFPFYQSFVERKHGHFVLVSSLASMGSIAHPAYSSSKACITTMGQGLRRDLKSTGVKVSVITPGYVRSNMTIERHNSRKSGLPFFVEQEDAVDIIYNGIQENIDVIMFPYPLAGLSWVLRIMPFYLQDYIGLAMAKLMYRGQDESSTDPTSQSAAAATTTKVD